MIGIGIEGSVLYQGEGFWGGMRKRRRRGRVVGGWESVMNRVSVWWGCLRVRAKRGFVHDG